MARKKSEFLSALGVVFEIGKAIIDAVFELGGNDDDLRRIVSDKELPRKIAEVIMDTVQKVGQPMVWPIWKTIQLGTGLKTADDFRRALKDGGHRLGDRANDILGKPAFTAATEKTEVDLVNVSVAELGFKDDAHQQDIYQRAQELGLEICPAEVGPQLRLQYKDQSMNEWLFIGMEPIIDSDGDLYVFSVERGDDGRWLDGNYGRPDFFWRGLNRWVFLRPK